jgi:carbamoyl-phosphate synthase small subunit
MAFFLTMKEGILTLENGASFKGQVAPWQKSPLYGEVVFTTGMTGYIESVTDPSYAGQILVFTYPLIGNYGVFSEKMWESARIYLRGVVISETTEHWSHYQGLHSFSAWLEQQNVCLLTGVDTRALTKVLRNTGTSVGVISEAMQDIPSFTGIDRSFLKSRVSIAQPEFHGKGKKRVVLVDCGMKSNILRSLLSFPSIEIMRVPACYDYTEEHYDGVFYSNGPGDPAEYTETIAIMKKAMKNEKPIYGICLGSQLMALASGATTYKLKFGHRGQNQPCLELSTGRCYITSQNHGYAVDSSTLNEAWKTTFINLNDQSVEGIAHKRLPFSSVQFHPEAAPGPTDTHWFFERFIECL